MINMNSRRSFVFGLGTLTLSQLLSACGNSNADLRISLLQNTLPLELIDLFKKQTSQTIAVKPLDQLKDTYELLNLKPTKAGFSLFPSTPPGPPDLITLGDYYLSEAIQNKLIQPLQTEQIASWKNLPSRFREVVKRDPRGLIDSDGSVWGAPYRWGMTVIAYNQEKFKAKGLKPPEDWADLWREDLRDRLSLLDQPREVIGLTLKRLGFSYNTPDLKQVPALQETLAALHQNVKLYSASHYLQPLIFGDTWIAVGWSNELFSLQKSYPQIKVIIPQSGTSLWSDLWVRNSKSTSTLVNQWIDFCWQAKAVNQISLFTSAASPMIFSLPKTELAQDILNNPLLYVDEHLLHKSEFIGPLSLESRQLYEAFWQRMRGIT